MNKLPKNKIDPEEIVLKLYDSLKDSGWTNIVKGFIVSQDFSTIIEELKDFVEDNKRFTPTLKDIFRPFYECGFSKLKVIFLNKYPAHFMNAADGLAFSCKNRNIPSAELEYLFREINSTIYDNKKDITSFDKDLSRWSNQGVLLLNTSVTTEIDNLSKEHVELWKPFIMYLIDMLLSNKENYVWVLTEDNYDYYIDIIGEGDNVLKMNLPPKSKYHENFVWDSSFVFKQINNKLKQLKKKEIIW